MKRYSHFSIPYPEEKKPELITMLQQYGEPERVIYVRGELMSSLEIMFPPLELHLFHYMEWETDNGNV